MILSNQAATVNSLATAKDELLAEMHKSAYAPEGV